LTSGSTTLSTLLDNLSRTERLPASGIRAMQSPRLQALLQHHASHTPSFSERQTKAGVPELPADPFEALASLPPLRRADIQSAGAGFRATRLPRAHQPTGSVKTSGSTGEPVAVERTALNHLFWSAFNIRDHLWNRRPFSARLSAIRANIGALTLSDDWGHPVSLIYKTGQAQGFPINTPIRQQVEWLWQFQPEILLVYPNNLKGLLDTWKSDPSRQPRLKHVRTLGETVSAELRSMTQQQCGVPIEDNYSSQEVGTIAIQCPASGLYHVMAEALIVEVLGEDNKPCREGQAGRVVVTDLMNYANPLIRYDIGDYAIPGPPCPCGRTLPTLKTILGRERNLMRLPGGEKCWPLVGFHRFDEVAPIRQYQFIQHTLEDIEFKTVTRDELTPEQQVALIAIAQAALGPSFQIRITQSRTSLNNATNGKFEEFVCRIR
jgi:phenylacetate-CoA ligase